MNEFAREAGILLGAIDCVRSTQPETEGVRRSERKVTRRSQSVSHVFGVHVWGSDTLASSGSSSNRFRA